MSIAFNFKELLVNKINLKQYQVNSNKIKRDLAFITLQFSRWHRIVDGLEYNRIVDGIYFLRVHPSLYIAYVMEKINKIFIFTFCHKTYYLKERRQHNISHFIGK